MRKKRKFLAALMAVTLSMTGIFGTGITARADSCGGLEEEDVYTPDEDEVIKDPVLHWAIRSSMNAIKSNVKLTADMVGDKSVRNISFELCSHADDFATWEKPFWIENLEGIQYAKSATMVDIGYTAAFEKDGEQKSIKDVSPLAELTQLDNLILKQDGIDDVSSLGTLVNLTQLDLSMNYKIEDISVVQNMKQLNTLNVSSNKITDVSAISGLTKLQYLNLSNNKISELPDMSSLTGVKTLLISDNQLTDVTPIASLKNLEALDLTKNRGLTDVKALANLIYLDKDRTYMPTEEMKTDLFAAIDVNKILNTFNISKMTSGDLENVQKALDAYEALTDEQKTYLDSSKMEAAKNNKEKVENGEAPEYYPEYDNGGEKQPVLDRLEIKVVDKNGKPMSGIPFIRSRRNTGAEPSDLTVNTDENGILTLKHTSVDTWYDKIVVMPSGDDYVASPESIEYTVKVGNKTETINGKAATGLEELQFVLVSKNEYADKTELEKAIKASEKVEEEYKYTEDSYAAYKEALSNAKKVNDDKDASKEAVNAAAEALNNAINNLKKNDKLTTLKVIVKDANGNLFTRPFKFQYTSDKGGYNSYSDAHTSIMYLQASAAWEDGETWKLFPCYEELYSADPVINFTVGKKDGKSYFKEINGKKVDADFEQEVTVTWTGFETEGYTPRKADSAVLKETIGQMKTYQEASYTPASFKVLSDAISSAEKIADKTDTTQEEYNAAVAEMKKAVKNLQTPAEKTNLKNEINLEATYTESNYTTASWKVYTDELAAAKKVYNDGNATQDEVDAALKALKKAEADLKWRPDTTELQETLDKAKALNEEDYQSGWSELQEAIKNAEKVLKNGDATSEEIKDAKTGLDTAIDGLVKKTVEANYACDPGIFRAKVMDENGNPLAGVKFEVIVDGDVDMTMSSDTNGIITYYLYGKYKGKAYVKLADSNYTTEDEHYFTAKGLQYAPTFDQIDGQPYADGTKLTYTLKKAGSVTPPEEKVLSDTKTFRAKVVDEDGNAVDGVEFEITPDDELADTYTATSKDGVIAQTLTTMDYAVTFTVKLADDQKDTDGKVWKCDSTHTYKTNGNMITAPNIVAIDGKTIEEAGEIVFVLTKDNGDTPSPVEKVLSDAKTFRAKVVDEDGIAVNGVKFDIGEEGANPKTVESKDGRIEYQIDASNDIQKTYTVKLSQNDTWKCADEHVLKTNGFYGFGNAQLTTIDGKTIEEAGEIVYVLTKDGGNTPETVDKSKLQEAVNDADILKEADYTAETWSAYQDALDAAKKVLADENATQQEVNDKLAAVKAAFGNLVKAEKPVITDKNAIRIKLQDEDGNAVTDSVTFVAATDMGSKFNLYSSKGVAEYPISDGDAGINRITVTLKDEFVTINGKNYVLTPEKHEFTIQTSTLGTVITKIDGEDIGDGKEVVFTLTEKKSEAVDKSELQAKNDSLKDIKQGDYTKNSYKALQTALLNAQTVLDNPDATQSDVDNALEELKETEANLKIVQGSRKLTIELIGENGFTPPANIKFIRDNVRYNVQTVMFGNKGELTWNLSGNEDVGDYEFYLPEDSGYIATPGIVKVKVGKEDGTSVIESVNGLNGKAQIKIAEKGKDSCDKVTFRAVVQNEEGKILPDITFNVKNGDPETVTSDGNGMITYSVTSWDIDTTMTVSMQDNEQWKCDKTVSFVVVDDPEDSGRGIIGELDGKAFTGNEKVVFTLVDKNRAPEVDKSGWKKVDGKWYYLDKNGEKQTGWKKVDGKWYYLDQNGVMQTGWQKVDGKWYYMNTSGAMLTGWQKINGKWYYMNASGAMLTGWQKINGKWYYMNASGAMLTGWQKINGKWYYMNTSGAMLTGWQKINGKWYYMNTSGAMQTGWLKLGNKWYYLNASGAMVTGSQKIGGKWYRFNASGVWIK